MTFIQQIREDRENLRGKSWKEKVSHIFTYYWFPILVILVVLIVGISLIRTNVSAREPALSGILLNCRGYDSMLSDTDSADFSAGFLEELSLDPSDYTLSFRMNMIYSQGGGSAAGAYSDYQSLMTIMSCVAAGELDFITGDLGTMVGLAYQDYFADLSQVLGQEQYECYEPYFLYVDLAVMEKINSRAGEAEKAEVEIPDCRKPETMERPVPVLIDMSGSGELQSVYAGFADTLAFGFIANAPHPENTLQYIDYLMR